MPRRARRMNLDHLGTPLRPMTRLHGKGFNRMYRLDTDQGSFAVKELNLDRDWTFRHDDVFRLERAAFAAGIPMPEPISADADVLVHRWVEGEKLPEEPVSKAFAFEIGEILALIHALDVEPTIFRSVLDGYVARSGALPPSGPSWFVFMIGGWLGFTRWNILRCLSGVEAPTGPDLAMCHEEVRNGLHGLPDMFGRLPEL